MSGYIYLLKCIKLFSFVFFVLYFLCTLCVSVLFFNYKENG